MKGASTAAVREVIAATALLKRIQRRKDLEAEHARVADAAHLPPGSAKLVSLPRPTTSMTGLGTHRYARLIGAWQAWPMPRLAA